MTGASYVVVGDSQAEGLMLPTALPRVLGDRLVVGLDRRGYSSRRLLDENVIATALGSAAANDAALLIFAGGNDPIPDTPEKLAIYRDTLLDIVRAAAEKSARTGVAIDMKWFGPVFALHDYDDRQHPAVARAQRAILGSSDVRRTIASVPGARVTVRWIDSQPLTRDLARETNVHLTAAGYAKYAERAVSRIEGGGWGPLVAAAAGYVLWRASRAS